MKRLKKTRDNWKAYKHSIANPLGKKNQKNVLWGIYFLLKKKWNIIMFHFNINNYIVYRKPCSVAFAT